MPNSIYRVEYSAAARQDAKEYAQNIRDQEYPQAARRWTQSLAENVLSLKYFPNRYAVIPENDEFEFDYRQFMHHSHRVIYRVDETLKLVYVVRVYHGSRRELTSRDLLDHLN